MFESNVTAPTRKFYERYRFPGSRPMDQDGLVFLRHFTSAVAAMERKGGKDAIRVLDAGCGTGNTSIALARAFTGVQFVGIDQSKNSLQEAKEAAVKEGLRNLRFRRWDLLKLLVCEKPFDLVLCLGVLHHIPDMKVVLVNLRRVMKKTGMLFLWVYGKHGRDRHTLNARALRCLVKNSPREEVLRLAIEFVRRAGKGSVITDLLGKTPVDEMQRKAFEDPVWIADQFLNPHEELLDIEELLALVKSAGFTIGQNLGGPGDTKVWLDSAMLLECYGRLAKNEQLIVLDLLEKPERYFLMLRLSGRMNR